MLIPSDEELLASVDSFLERHDMKPTRFGREATGEPQLIDSWRGGRSPSLKTLRRVASFMKDYEADKSASPGNPKDISPAPRQGPDDGDQQEKAA